MAKSKNKPMRRPEEVEVTSRRGMKLRSPSVRRPTCKFRDGPVKPTSGCVSAWSSPERSPPPPTLARSPPPLFGPAVRQTERSRAIVTALERSERVKRLDAIHTPPDLPRATPTKFKKSSHIPRHTPPRKNIVQPPRPPQNRKVPNPKPPQKSKEPVVPNPEPPRKRKLVTRPVAPVPPEVVLEEPALPDFSAPNPSSPPQTPRKPQTTKANNLTPRRSPKGVSKSNSRGNTQSRPALPNFSAPPPPLPASPASPAISHDDEPPALDFDPSFENNASDDEGEHGEDNVPSIRCKSSGYVHDVDERGDKRKVRGVVNGSTVANYKHTYHKEQPIKVEFRPDGRGPANRTVGSLLVHEIGSAVRDKVPMMASSFKKLGEEDRRIVYDHLSPNFVVDPEDDQLWNHIFKKATERYRDWKSDCKTFFQTHGPEIIPREFLDRPDQWTWLVSHFNEPKNQERGKKMSGVRSMPERMNHRSGKCPFYQRDTILTDEGEKTPHVATYSHAYSKDPTGAALAKQMQEKVREYLRQQNGDASEECGCVLDDQGPLPLAAELDIIAQVVGQKHGTYISGIGNSFKKPPLPRGGARNSEVEDQLQKQKEEFLEMKEAFENRIRVSEELVVRGGSTNLTSNNASEGATSYGPAS